VNRRGFTLLEVLVATVVMAIAVVGVLSALSATLRNAARLTDYDRIALLARSQMDSLLVEPLLPRQTFFGGSFNRANSGGIEGGWRARVEPFEGPPRLTPGARVLDRIDLELWWQTPAGRRTFRLEGYRPRTLKPEDIAPAQ
jgi:general secretion pathway protein I